MIAIGLGLVKALISASNMKRALISARNMKRALKSGGKVIRRERSKTY